MLLALLTIASFSRLKEYLQRLEMVQGSTEIMQGVHSMEKNIYYVYLLTNKHRHNIYVGLTKNLSSSVWRQAFKVLRNLLGQGLCTRLVYFERYQDGMRAEVRKVQLKNTSFYKTFALVERTNPGWCSLRSERKFECSLPM